MGWHSKEDSEDTASVCSLTVFCQVRVCSHGPSTPRPCSSHTSPLPAKKYYFMSCRTAHLLLLSNHLTYGSLHHALQVPMYRGLGGVLIPISPQGGWDVLPQNALTIEITQVFHKKQYKRKRSKPSLSEHPSPLLLYTRNYAHVISRPPSVTLENWEVHKG